MPTVALDISALDPEFRSHAHRGIGRYVAGLSKALGEIPNPPVTVKTFSHRDVQALNSRAISLLEKGATKLPVFKMTMRQQVIQPLKLSALARSFDPKADMLHFPAHMDAPAFANQPTCVTVLDLIPLVLSDMYKAATASWRFHFARFLEQRAITRASLILCISECTARDTIRLLNVPEEKIAVTPLAVEPASFLSASSADIGAIKLAHRINAAYFLYVGGIDPRKNIVTLLKAHDELCKKYQQTAKPLPLLLLAGKIRDDRQYPIISDAIKTMSHSSQVRELGFVTDAELSALYRNATGFVFASLYEGFGFPLLEAFAARCPVICSNNSSLPEVAGDAALTVDPLDANSIAAAMSNLLENPNLREQLIAKGEKRVPLFSWQATADKTMAAYERHYRKVGR